MGPEERGETENVNDEERENNAESEPSLHGAPDSNLESDNEPSARRSINDFTFLLTNARSLAPKIDNFVENFHERDVDL